MSKLFLVVLMTGAVVSGLAQRLPTDAHRQPIRDIHAYLDGDWIVAGQGRDETAQSLRLGVWGSVRHGSFPYRRFEQLDDDPEKEYIVISRNRGTGPYYKLQIIDFRPHGILTWSYDSMGTPKVENAKILLGDSQPYIGAFTMPKYKAYTYTAGGLVAAQD